MLGVLTPCFIIVYLKAYFPPINLQCKAGEHFDLAQVKDYVDCFFPYLLFILLNNNILNFSSFSSTPQGVESIFLALRI